jgi:hypothetical protein
MDVFSAKILSIKAIPSKHSMSYLVANMSQSPSVHPLSMVGGYLFAGISILSCGASSFGLSLSYSVFGVVNSESTDTASRWSFVRLHLVQCLRRYVSGVITTAPIESRIPNSKHSSSNSSVVYSWLRALKRAYLSTEMVGMLVLVGDNP